VYLFDSYGANAQQSVYDLKGVIASTSSTGGPMTYDIIIDNTFRNNDMAGVVFVLDRVSRDVVININDNDIDFNGIGVTGSGVMVRATSCTGDIAVSVKQNNVRNNRGRGVYVDVWDYGVTVPPLSKLNVQVTESNTFTGNRAAGLLMDMDTVRGDVTILVDNSTFATNTPGMSPDNGAITLRGGSLSAGLDIKLADTTGSRNTGTGLMIDMGGSMAVNLAKTTKYTMHNCVFSQNTEYGVYLFDSYGANAQQSVYDLKGVIASDNNQAVYIHSNSALGNINFQLDGLTAADSDTTVTAVTIQLAAASFAPKAVLRDVEITYSGGSAPGATGLALQGVESNQRWSLNLLNSKIAQPGTALEANFCEINVRNSNLTGMGVNSVLARDSNVHLYYCQVPDLSAQTMGTSVSIGVFFYKWFNVSLVAWQNGEPIDNTTVLIKRYNAPQEDVYTAATDATGKLAHAQIPFWQRDENNNPLRNDELQAFANIRGEVLNSLWFDFNETKIGIEDPDLPILVINSPAENTVQKSSTLVVQGEIRDSHSGIRAVEVSLDNVIWVTADIPAVRWGKSKSAFEVPFTDLTDGVYTVLVRGWDKARYPFENLTATLVEVENIKIDTTPPALQMDQPPNPYHVTNNQTYTLIGKTERSANIRKLTINGTEFQIYGFTFSLDVDLNEGSNFFVIIVEDTAGNIAIATREIILDTMAPTLIVTSPVPGFSSKERDFEVAGDTEKTADVYVQVDDGIPKLVTGRGDTRFVHVQNINDEGMHKLTVISEDEAGNRATKEIWVKYDITPPVLEDIVPPFDPKPTNNQRVYVSGHTDTEVAQVVVNGLIFPVYHGDFALEINLLEGYRVLKIEVTDPAGNYNATTRNILVDVTPPLLVDLSVSSTKVGGDTWEMDDGLTINERSVRFRGRVAEPDYRELWVQVGSDNRTAIVDDPATHSFYRDFNLNEGENIVSFYAIDIAGNRIRYIFILQVDPRAPQVDYLNPRMTSAMEATVYESTIQISGKITDVSTVTLMINNRQVIVVPDTGAFQTTVPLELGLNNIEVEAVDRAGNKATDLLHVNYALEGADESSIGETLATYWWVFALIIGLAILIPFTVQRSRTKWEEEHPELRQYDPQLDREGLYEYEDTQDEYRGGGY
jgi:hypothetical protein